jgi:PTH1 family peptidyl-tRNA hydrolase
MNTTFSLIVGLGNPGSKYEGTRHNAGFEVVDNVYRVLSRRSPESRTSTGVLVSGECEGHVVHLLKPLTFMNSSGVSVRQTAFSLGVTAEEILVVYDCVDLPLGRLRLRRSGSSGGHRGVESIIRELETEKFPRLRVGIGRPESETIDHVLSSWTSAERPVFARVVSAASRAVLTALRDGIEAAMNSTNGWSADEHDATEDQEKSR